MTYPTPPVPTQYPIDPPKDAIRAALEAVRVRELAEINSARLIDAVLAVLDACDEPRHALPGVISTLTVRKAIEDALRGGR